MRGAFVERKLKHVKGKGAFVEEKDQKDQIWEGGKRVGRGGERRLYHVSCTKSTKPLGTKAAAVSMKYSRILHDSSP